MRSIFLLLLLTATSVISAQSTLAIEIDGIYNFSPSKITRQQQEEKLPSLDRFWDKVKADTAGMLPQLRKELAATGHNPFFYFDGTGLLLSLSNNKADKELAAAAIARCDIKDIDREIYVVTLNQLASDGINVTPAALKILADDKYSFYIAKHALEYNQGYCLSYMLLPQNEINYTDTLIALFHSLSPVAQNSVVTTLWFAATCKGDAFLKNLAADNTVKKDMRTYISNLLAHTALIKEEAEMVKTMSEKELKDFRANALHRLSDEAIEDLDLSTRLLQKQLKCN